MVPSSTCERTSASSSTFSKWNSSRARYKPDSMGDRDEPCPTPTLVVISSEISPFQRYFVRLFSRDEKKKLTKDRLNPCLCRVINNISWFIDGKYCAISNAITLVFSPFAHPARTK